MFIEINNFFCIDTTKINSFKQFQDYWKGQLCVVYTDDYPKGIEFEDKDGKLYNSLKKIFNTCDVLNPNIEQLMISQSIINNNEKVEW